MMENNASNIEHLINVVSTIGHNLTEWEEDFITSIAVQFNERRRLTDRQFEILERIYAEKTP